MAILALAVVLGFVSAVPNVTTNRTQAGEVAAAIATSGRPGDVVAYCPDQLGPAVDRLLPSGRYQQITFPRETGPAYVNWVDYGAAVSAASPVTFAEKVEAMAAGGHQIFVVWSPGYQTYGLKCETIVQALAADHLLPGHRSRGLEQRHLLPADGVGPPDTARVLTAWPGGCRR